MALAGAKLFVDEGAHVFISGRRKDALDEAVKVIGRNVTGVQADSADLDDLDRLFETVKQEKGALSAAPVVVSVARRPHGCLPRRGDAPGGYPSWSRLVSGAQPGAEVGADLASLWSL